jgi:outer membrane protein assembly factor BamD (BamD/ComL family)
MASASRREIAQLNKIRAVLDRDPARAHRLIAASSREFPSGLLAEERAGLDAIALFRSGERRSAAAAAERFIAEHPNSPLRPRLERILAGDSP